MYQYVLTWVFGFKVLRFLSQCIYVCTSMYLLGFLVLRFSGFCLLCTSMSLPGFLVLSFSGFCTVNMVFLRMTLSN